MHPRSSDLSSTASGSFHSSFETDLEAQKTPPTPTGVRTPPRSVGAPGAAQNAVANGLTKTGEWAARNPRKAAALGIVSGIATYGVAGGLLAMEGYLVSDMTKVSQSMTSMNAALTNIAGPIQQGLGTMVGNSNHAASQADQIISQNTQIIGLLQQIAGNKAANTTAPVQARDLGALNGQD